MKDPGPNVLEQQIETNRLLALIAAAGPAAPGLATLSGGAVPVQWPILFYFSNPSSNPFTIIPGPGGGSGAISVLDRNSINAGAGLKLIVPTGTGQWVRAQIDIPQTPTRKMRLQLALAHAPEQQMGAWYISLSYYDRTNLHRAEVILDSTGAESFWLKSDGSQPSLGQFTWSYKDNAWNKVDFSVNFATDMYHSAIVNHASADLSAEGLRPIASPDWPKLTLRIELRNNAADRDCIGYVDQVLVTPELYDIPDLPE